MFHLQLWPWRQFVYAAFASRDIGRPARTPAVSAEGKGRDHAGSAEERRRRRPHILYFIFQIIFSSSHLTNRETADASSVSGDCCTESLNCNGFFDY